MNRSSSGAERRSSRQIEGIEARENGFQLVFEKASIGIAVIGLDFRIEQANASLGKLLGWAPLELIGVDYLSLTHKDDRDRHLAMAQKLLRGEIEWYKLDESVTRRDGTPVAVSVGVRCVRDAHGEVSHILATLETVNIHKAGRKRGEPESSKIEGRRANLDSSAHKMMATERGAVRLADVERDHIIKVLERTLWRIEGPKGAASLLGMNPATLRSRMKKLEIKRPRTD